MGLPGSSEVSPLARGKKVHGECHLCGQHKKLSFEHVPPESAFNDRPRLLINLKRVLGLEPNARNRLEQRGGDYTLCEDCNNVTGAWYGGAYVRFVEQAMSLLSRATASVQLQYPYYIMPLRVIKQVVAMFVSAVGPGWTDRNPYLRKFLLDRYSTGFPPEYHIYAGYSMGPFSRQSGFSASGDLAGHSRVFAEVTFPPFAFVLTMNSAPPDTRLVDLTYFAQAGYNDWRQQFLELRVLPTWSHLPGDYRGPDELRHTVEANGGDWDEELKRLQLPR